MNRFYQVKLDGATWNLRDRYQKLQFIGSGSYGQVAKASVGQSNSQVAIKKISQAFDSKDYAKLAFRELSVLMHVSHPNLISLLDVFLSPNKTDIYLVTHLMEADLHKVIHTQNLTEEHIQSFLSQIVNGLAYLHARGIVHRDLKPSNIAINGNCDLRILDFGLARAASSEMTGYVVTRWYRAPEVIFSWREYDQAVDVWSVGCILAELITSQVLFRGKNTFNQLTVIFNLVGTPSAALINKISNSITSTCLSEEPHRDGQDFNVVFRNASPLAIDLLKRMLQLDPEERISSLEALKHPYLKDYSTPTEEDFHPIYDQSFETSNLSLEDWRRIIIEKIDQFPPLNIESNIKGK
ncbi:uncharacterized protein Dwil_GK18964 [Drosophila willistoni]|uniref:mitogen-activated protein kinase n=1 Tax=Drosophila willistoni TaxID=7260 RepID=B4NJI8_DROWI|nr:mitogen-activated protein kinase HOG1 [Drosophila willistoni]EDW83912.1 uncharacterized protein Dwil_GK18964 [Drosophila willistoni]